MKKRKIMIPLLFSLAGGITGHSAEKLNIPYDYSGQISVDGYETENYSYDFDNDGVEEKVVVNYKQNGFKIETVVSIYTMQDGSYRLTYQIPLEGEADLFSLKGTEKALNEIKKFYPEYSKNIQNGEVRYIRMMADNRSDKIDINLKFDKYSPENLDNFFFVKTSASIKEAPASGSSTVYSLGYKNKPKINFEITSVKNNTEEKWYSVEYREEAKKKEDQKNKPVIKGFIQAHGDNIIKRGFYWNKMEEKIDKVNSFIKETLSEGKEVYIITEYVPLAKDFYSEKDKFGNRDNQSVKGYEKSDKTGEKINIPDQTIMRILSEENGMLKIETPLYGTYFIEKNEKKYKKSDITGEINKFIMIDPDSQNEAIIQRAKDTDKYEVVTYSFVTTGKDSGGSSYETPHGAFLVSFTRPYMQFTGRSSNIPQGRQRISGNLYVAGDAKWAVRFSGGAYMHGIPASFGPGKEAKKAYTATKIGTFKESHKCVRHYDDQIGFIVEWVNGGSQNKQKENTIPAEPVAVIVL